MSYCQSCGKPTQKSIPQGDNRERLCCYHCGFIQYENPKIICGAILQHQGKILLCRRAIEPRMGLWTLPAGFMELGETLLAGAKRECFEEAQAHSNNLNLYCLYDIPSIGQIHVMFRGDLSDGQFGAGEESLECALFAEHEIPWQDLAFENVKYTLKLFLKDRKNNHFPLHQITLRKDQSISLP